jgi:hypothetical protein
MLLMTRSLGLSGLWYQSRPVFKHLAALVICGGQWWRRQVGSTNPNRWALFWLGCYFFRSSPSK